MSRKANKLVRKSADKEPPVSLEEQVKADKKQREQDCQAEIDVVLKKYNCTLISGYVHWEGNPPQFPKMVVAL